MLLNDLKLTDTKGDIYYKFENGNTIKLGTFEIDTKYNHVKIELGICTLEYEFRTDEMRKDCIGLTPHMYWFKSQYVCNRYHGTYSRDNKWVLDLFNEITPYTDDINNLIISFIEQVIDITECGQLGKEVA